MLQIRQEVFVVSLVLRVLPVLAGQHPEAAVPEHGEELVLAVGGQQRRGRVRVVVSIVVVGRRA